MFFVQFGVGQFRGEESVNFFCVEFRGTLVNDKLVIDLVINGNEDFLATQY
jgi:hypothetical protein